MPNKPSVKYKPLTLDSQFFLGKEFFIPGLIVEQTCAVCGAVAKFDGNNGDSLYYPVFNAKHKLRLHCRNDHEAEVVLKLTLNIEAA